MSHIDDIDNAGTGFALDDADIDGLFAESSIHEEPDDFDSNNFMRNYQTEPQQTPTQREPEPVREPEPEPVYVDEQEVVETQEPVYVDEQADPEPTYAEPEPEPVYVTEEQPEPVTTISRPTKIEVPTIKSELKTALRVIKTVDAYRALTEDQRNVASQFINEGEIIEEEHAFVVKAMNTDPDFIATMEALKEAKGLIPVDRAFYVVDLNDALMHNVGNLVGVFIEEEIPENLSHNAYAKQLVAKIEELDSKAMTYVEATQSVLSSAKDVG